jgi:LCP family protein required for cell wall assembly
MLRFAPPLLEWYRRYRARRAREERTSLLKRVALILLAVLLAFLLLAGVTKALLGLRMVGMRTILNVTGAELQTDADGFTNILLLGQGDATHEGKDLTDAIMVASLDPRTTKSIVLLSLPRDLYFLRTEKMGKGRLNSMYRDYRGYLRAKGMSFEGASQEALRELAAEIGKHLSLKIHAVLKADFIGFEKAIDAVGGVDLEVPYDIIDTQFPGPNYTYETFEIRAGPQHLDGEAALKYVRSRHTTSDFDRSARQQQLLHTLGAKLKDEGLLSQPATLVRFLDIVGDHLETTMSLRELAGLMKLGLMIARDRIIAMQLHDRNGLYGSPVEPGGFLYTPPRDQFEGASVLLPVSIPEFPVTWKQIQTLTQLLFRTRSIYLSRPAITVLNGGAKTGLGRHLANELLRFGLNVVNVANAPLPKKLEESILFAGTPREHDEASALFFSSLLHLPLRNVPPTLPLEEISEVTILLGKDYTFTPLQDLLPPVYDPSSR